MLDVPPPRATDSDARIQALISEDLENSMALRAAFDEALRGGRAGRWRAMPKPDDFFPNLVRSQGDAWLEPLLGRLRAEADAKRRDRLADMINWLIENIGQVTEAQYLALAGHADGFRMPACFHYLTRMLELARRLETAAPLSAAVAQAIRRLMVFAQRIYVTPGGWEAFVWPLFRAEHGFGADDPCWSARIRRDLGTLEPDLRAAWLPVFDARNSTLAGACELSKSALAAIEQLGQGQLEAGLRRWVAMLQEPALTAVGGVILRHVLLLCDLLGGAACDELLYEIARAPWPREQDAGWLKTYLWVLGRRTNDRAFACLEALAMNPATATDEVRFGYQSALQAFEAESRGTGVDGYPLNRDPALEPQQRRIEQLLRLCAAAVERGPYIHPSVALHGQLLEGIKEENLTPALKRMRAQLVAPKPWFDPGPEVAASLKSLEKAILADFPADSGLYTAAINRLDWILAHQKEYSREMVKAWTQCLRGFGCEGGILQKAMTKVDRQPLALLLRAMQRIGGNWKVFEQCRQYVLENGWSVELVEALRAWIPTLGNSATSHLYRAKAEWFLWFEDVAPIRLEDCWGERVRQDLRAMQPEERKAWLGLLENSSFTITGEPPKKWLAAAEAAFPKIGHAEFRCRFLAWFQPFAAGEPLRLTVTGRNVLRLLMWTALLAKDPAVDRALAGFAGAQWKTKECVQRAAQAEMAFSYVLAERSPETALPILREMVRSGRARPGTSTHRTYQRLGGR